MCAVRAAALFFVALAALVAVGLFFLRPAWRQAHHMPAPSGNAAAPTVEIVTVQQADLPERIASVGTLLANQAVSVSAELPGQIAAILFKEGQTVKQGAPLIRLDDAVDRANLQSAEAGLAFSRANFARMQDLVRRGAQARQALDAARADLRDKESQVAVLTTNLTKRTLVAPFDGTLSHRAISVGQYVQAGQGLVDIVDAQRLRISYRVPERFLAQLRVGQSVAVSTDVFPGATFEGSVFFISPMVDEATRTVELQAWVNNGKNRLLPGMFVKATQTLGILQGVLFLPEQCLVPTVEGESVYKFVQGKVMQTPVVIGGRFAGKVQILKGVSAGDQVVSAGQQKLQDGSPVTVVRPPA